jgi:hypothetical protein
VSQLQGEEKMSENTYGMKGCPWQLHELEFEHGEDDYSCNFDFNVRLGKEGYKYGKESYIDIDADQGGAYPLGLSIKVDGKWHKIEEASAVRVVIRGDYEQRALLAGLQNIALMSLPVYGKMKTYSEQAEEHENAIREQTKTI